MAQDITLPDGWKWTTVSEITLPIEKVMPQAKPKESFTYLDISSINNKIHKIVEPKVYLGVEAPSRARQLVRSNDVLFSTVRTYLENLALVPELYDGQIASTGFSVLRASEAVLPKFLFYYSMTNTFLEPLNELQRGTSYPAVRDGDVRVQPFPLPPLSEQERIVAKIEELFTQLEAGTGALRRVQAELKHYKASVLKAACEGRLVPQDLKDESVPQLLERILNKDYAEKIRPLETNKIPYIPPGWAYGKLEHLIYIAGRIGWRGMKAEEYTKEGPLLLSVYNLNKGDYVEFNDVYHISQVRYDESPEIMLREKDILLTKDGAGIGKIGIINNLSEPATVNSSLLVIRANEIFIPEFLFYLLKGPQMQDIVRARITGSATPHLFQRDIKQFTLLIPPLAEQHRIVAEVERRLSVAAEVEVAVGAAQVRSARLRQAILKRAFEGKLVSQNSEDEPA
jgi:type I restriction enzyme S subunit